MCGKSTEHYAEFWRAVQEMWLRVYGCNMVTIAAVNVRPLEPSCWSAPVFCHLLQLVCAAWAGSAKKSGLSVLKQVQGCICWDVWAKHMPVGSAHWGVGRCGSVRCCRLHGSCGRCWSIAAFRLWWRPCSALVSCWSGLRCPLYSKGHTQEIGCASVLRAGGPGGGLSRVKNSCRVTRKCHSKSLLQPK